MSTLVAQSAFAKTQIATLRRKVMRSNARPVQPYLYPTPTISSFGEDQGQSLWLNVKGVLAKDSSMMKQLVKTVILELQSVYATRLDCMSRQAASALLGRTTTKGQMAKSWTAWLRCPTTSRFKVTPSSTWDLRPSLVALSITTSRIVRWRPTCVS